MKYNLLTYNLLTILNLLTSTYKYLQVLTSTYKYFTSTIYLLRLTALQRPLKPNTIDHAFKENGTLYRTLFFICYGSKEVSLHCHVKLPFIGKSTKHFEVTVSGQLIYIYVTEYCIDVKVLC